MFFFKTADKIWTLRTTFLKVPTTNEPFGFRFSKDAETNLSVRIPVILRRGKGVGEDKKCLAARVQPLKTKICPSLSLPGSCEGD